MERGDVRRVPWSTLAAVSAGGALGALARWLVTTAFPHPPGTFAWATWGVNVSGCLLIGVLMAVVDRWPDAPRLLRPFLGPGVLGGFTTFSSHIVEAQEAVRAGAALTGLLYLVATLACGLAAAYAGMRATRPLLVRRSLGEEQA